MRGTVQNVEHQPGSGIAQVIVLDEDGTVSRLACDAGPLLRSPIKVGMTIDYEMSDYGTMESFEIVEEGS